jgi:hypothetical protein
MEIHALTSEAALESLRAGRNGLSEGEATARLAEFGSNRVERVRRAPLAVQVAGEFVHLLSGNTHRQRPPRSWRHRSCWQREIASRPIAG